MACCFFPFLSSSCFTNIFEELHHQVSRMYLPPRIGIDALVASSGVTIDHSEGSALILSVSEIQLREWKGKIGEDDHAVVFSWSPSLHMAVSALNMTQPALPTWCPAGTAYPLSVDSVKSMILHICQAGNTAGDIVSMFVIAPNNLVEYANMITTLAFIQSDAFILQMTLACQSPLASVFMFHDASRKTTATPLNLRRPFNLAAADIQAFV